MASSTARNKSTTAAAEQAEVDRDNELRKAYGAATQRLRDEHRDEFNSLYSEEAKKRGVEWSPRPTAEERAAQQMRDLLAAHPGLMDKMRDGEDAESV